MDDMVTRQMDVIEEARQQAAAQERETVDKLVRLVEIDLFPPSSPVRLQLNNATKKIEDLEAQLKEKDSEVSRSNGCSGLRFVLMLDDVDRQSSRRFLTTDFGNRCGIGREIASLATTFVKKAGVHRGQAVQGLGKHLEG